MKHLYVSDDHSLSGRREGRFLLSLDEVWGIGRSSSDPGGSEGEKRERMSQWHGRCLRLSPRDFSVDFETADSSLCLYSQYRILFLLDLSSVGSSKGVSISVLERFLNCVRGTLEKVFGFLNVFEEPDRPSLSVHVVALARDVESLHRLGAIECIQSLADVDQLITLCDRPFQELETALSRYSKQMNEIRLVEILEKAAFLSETIGPKSAAPLCFVVTDGMGDFWGPRAISQMLETKGRPFPRALSRFLDHDIPFSVVLVEESDPGCFSRVNNDSISRLCGATNGDLMLFSGDEVIGGRDSGLLICRPLDGRESVVVESQLSGVSTSTSTVRNVSMVPPVPLFRKALRTYSCFCPLVEIAQCRFRDGFAVVSVAMGRLCMRRRFSSDVLLEVEVQEDSVCCEVVVTLIAPSDGLRALSANPSSPPRFLLFALRYARLISSCDTRYLSHVSALLKETADSGGGWHTLVSLPQKHWFRLFDVEKLYCAGQFNDVSQLLRSVVTTQWSLSSFLYIRHGFFCILRLESEAIDVVQSAELIVISCFFCGARFDTRQKCVNEIEDSLSLRSCLIVPRPLFSVSPPTERFYPVTYSRTATTLFDAFISSRQRDGCVAIRRENKSAVMIERDSLALIDGRPLGVRVVLWTSPCPSESARQGDWAAERTIHSKDAVRSALFRSWDELSTGKLSYDSRSSSKMRNMGNEGGCLVGEDQRRALAGPLCLLCSSTQTTVQLCDLEAGNDDETSRICQNDRVDSFVDVLVTRGGCTRLRMVSKADKHSLHCRLRRSEKSSEREDSEVVLIAVPSDPLVLCVVSPRSVLCCALIPPALFLSEKDISLPNFYTSQANGSSVLSAFPSIPLVSIPFSFDSVVRFLTSAQAAALAEQVSMSASTVHGNEQGILDVMARSTSRRVFERALEIGDSVTWLFKSGNARAVSGNGDEEGERCEDTCRIVETLFASVVERRFGVKSHVLCRKVFVETGILFLNVSVDGEETELPILLDRCMRNSKVHKRVKVTFSAWGPGPMQHALHSVKESLEGSLSEIVCDCDGVSRSIDQFLSAFVIIGCRFSRSFLSGNSRVDSEGWHKAIESGFLPDGETHLNQNSAIVLDLSSGSLQRSCVLSSNAAVSEDASGNNSGRLGIPLLTARSAPLQFALPVSEKPTDILASFVLSLPMSANSALVLDRLWSSLSPSGARELVKSAFVLTIAASRSGISCAASLKGDATSISSFAQAFFRVEGSLFCALGYSDVVERVRLVIEDPREILADFPSCEGVFSPPDPPYVRSGALAMSLRRHQPVALQSVSGAEPVITHDSFSKPLYGVGDPGFPGAPFLCLTGQNESGTADKSAVADDGGASTTPQAPWCGKAAIEISALAPNSAGPLDAAIRSIIKVHAARLQRAFKARVGALTTDDLAVLRGSVPSARCFSMEITPRAAVVTIPAAVCPPTHSLFLFPEPVQRDMGLLLLLLYESFSDDFSVFEREKGAKKREKKRRSDQIRDSLSSFAQPFSSLRNVLGKGKEIEDDSVETSRVYSKRGSVSFAFLSCVRAQSVSSEDGDVASDERGGAGEELDRYKTDLCTGMEDSKRRKVSRIRFPEQDSSTVLSAADGGLTVQETPITNVTRLDGTGDTSTTEYALEAHTFGFEEIRLLPYVQAAATRLALERGALTPAASPITISRPRGSRTVSLLSSELDQENGLSPEVVSMLLDRWRVIGSLETVCTLARCLRHETAIEIVNSLQKHCPVQLFAIYYRRKPMEKTKEESICLSCRGMESFSYLIVGSVVPGVSSEIPEDERNPWIQTFFTSVEEKDRRAFVSGDSIFLRNTAVTITLQEDKWEAFSYGCDLAVASRVVDDIVTSAIIRHREILENQPDSAFAPFRCAPIELSSRAQLIGTCYAGDSIPFQTIDARVAAELTHGICSHDEWVSFTDSIDSSSMMFAHKVRLIPSFGYGVWDRGKTTDKSSGGSLRDRFPFWKTARTIIIIFDDTSFARFELKGYHRPSVSITLHYPEGGSTSLVRFGIQAVLNHFAVFLTTIALQNIPCR